MYYLRRLFGYAPRTTAFYAAILGCALAQGCSSREESHSATQAANPPSMPTIARNAPSMTTTNSGSYTSFRKSVENLNHIVNVEFPKVNLRSEVAIEYGQAIDTWVKASLAYDTQRMQYDALCRKENREITPAEKEHLQKLKEQSDMAKGSADAMSNAMAVVDARLNDIN